MDPNFARADFLIVYAYAQQGRFEDALADLQHRHQTDDIPWKWATEAYVYAREGQQASAQLALATMERLNRGRQSGSAPMLAAVYSGMDEKDKAFAVLQSALLEHSDVLSTLKVDPVFDPLRGDPRFQVLLHRVGLGPERNHS